MATNINYIAFNGEFIPESDYLIAFNNRAFRYGDAIFETIHANGLECQFLSAHYHRLMRGMRFLGFKVDAEFTETQLKNTIKGVLSRCKLFQGARVKVTVMRKPGGLYLPQNENVDILVEASYLSKGPYELNSDGLIIGVYNEVRKPISPLFQFKNANGLIYILAGKFAVDNHFGDVLLLNDKNQLVEGTSSNLFCLKGNTLYTPSLASGCVWGTMRANIIELATAGGMTVVDDESIMESDLSLFDEVFFTNAIVGIKWVKAYKSTRYFKRVSSQLIHQLNVKAGFSSSPD